MSSPRGSIPDDVLEQVRDQLARDGAALTPERVAGALRERGRPVGDATVLAVHDALRRDVVGAGPLEPLLRTPGVTDVLVNGPDAVYLDRGQGLELTGVRLHDDESVRRLAQRLAASGGRRLDDATPHVDLRLPDGTRFHAVLAPVSRPGTVLSLRVPRGRAFTLAELVDEGAVPGDGAWLLRRIVECRLAFLVSGGTGSGKTTLLNALLSLVDGTERLVLVEDASELRPDHPHVVGLEARPANVEGAGEITLRTLVRQALRMRPDRLVVGEVREAESLDLLIALNSGLPGMCSLHANSATDALTKLSTLPLLAGRNIDASFVVPTVATSIDVVVHAELERTGHRRVVQIVAPTGAVIDGVIEAISIFELRGGLLQATGATPIRTAKFLRGAEGRLEATG